MKITKEQIEKNKENFFKNFDSMIHDTEKQKAAFRGAGMTVLEITMGAHLKMLVYLKGEYQSMFKDHKK